MKIQGNEIKIGMIIEINNDHWTVLKTQHVKPGKGGAFNQVELKSLTKGTKLNQRFRSSETVERSQLEEKKFNFLYSSENESFFMEPKTFEQISIKSNMLGEKLKLMTENVECEIENTEGVVKGQTAASSYKTAKLKNGIDVMVPPFIQEGDKIILDTRSLEYVKKVN